MFYKVSVCYFCLWFIATPHKFNFYSHSFAYFCIACDRPCEGKLVNGHHCSWVLPVQQHESTTLPASSASPSTLFKGYSSTSSQMNAPATTDAASPSLTVFPSSCTMVSSPGALPFLMSKLSMGLSVDARLSLEPNLCHLHILLENS
jgi:hypothetical protein